MKLSIKDFFNKYSQIRSFLWSWSHLLKKSLTTENFIYCAVQFSRWSVFRKSLRLRYLARLWICHWLSIDFFVIITIPVNKLSILSNWNWTLCFSIKQWKINASCSFRRSLLPHSVEFSCTFKAFQIIFLKFAQDHQISLKIHKNPSRPKYCFCAC